MELSVIEWSDDAIVLAVRRHGETGVLASLLTRRHGRHAGLVAGGAGRSMRAILQPGNTVRATWRARLAEQLGNFRLEPILAHSGQFLDDPGRLTALTAACGLCQALLPERQPHQPLFDAFSALLAAFAAPSWPSVYVHWELALLRDLGFGLDLSACAVSGASDNLVYVSPRSARAVSATAGQPYADKLLVLPAFLGEGREGSAAEIVIGLELTGYFLERHVLHHRHQPMPAARSRLVDRFRSLSTMAATNHQGGDPDGKCGRQPVPFGE